MPAIEPRDLWAWTNPPGSQDSDARSPRAAIGLVTAFNRICSMRSLVRPRVSRTDPAWEHDAEKHDQDQPIDEHRRFWSVHSPSSRPFVTQADGPVKARLAPAADNGNRTSRLPIKSDICCHRGGSARSGAPHARAGDACPKDIVCGQATCRPSESVITPSRHKPRPATMLARRDLAALLEAHVPDARLSFWHEQGRHEVDVVVEVDRRVFAIEVKAATRQPGGTEARSELSSG